MRKLLLTLAISAVLIFFLCVPIGFLIYGGGAAAFGGMLILGLLILIQLPVFIVFNKFGWLPTLSKRE
ncbi:hypothetical protein GC163_14325 [bacterium]|nr:hypothetical protein [bacterium]